MIFGGSLPEATFAGMLGDVFWRGAALHGISFGCFRSKWRSTERHSWAMLK